MYKTLIRPILFLFDPEVIHNFTFNFLQFVSAIPGVRFLIRSIYRLEDPKLHRMVFGLDFPNPVGLAAGFDKDARLVGPLSDLGFGFIEIGTVTPVGQPGNDKPRLFRLPRDSGLVNRMGFNNQGVISAVRRLKNKNFNVIIGGNIGKNKNTPNEGAKADFSFCFEELYDSVDYFVVNVSSPNTPGLRDLQEKEPLKELLNDLVTRNRNRAGHKPILLKIAPDLTEGQIDDIIDIVSEVGLDGLIATNTTVSREGLETSAREVDQMGAGGLSGRPLKDRSTEVIRYVARKTRGTLPIIGVGGIHDPSDALEKLDAGASLIQVYTGFVYQGPSFAKTINREILKNAGK